MLVVVDEVKRSSPASWFAGSSAPSWRVLGAVVGVVAPVAGAVGTVGVVVPVVTDVVEVLVCEESIGLSLPTRGPSSLRPKRPTLVAEDDDGGRGGDGAGGEELLLSFHGGVPSLRLAALVISP